MDFNALLAPATPQASQATPVTADVTPRTFVASSTAVSGALAALPAPPVLTPAPQPILPSAPTVATVGAEPGRARPSLAYVVRLNKPALFDNTPSKTLAVSFLGGAVGGVVLAAAALATGALIVDHNGIQNPSNDIARELAAAYAASHGYVLAAAPILVDKEHTYSIDKLRADVGGPQYVIDVDLPGMWLTPYALHWDQYRLAFFTSARVTEVASRKVVDRVGCNLQSQERANAISHDALLADSAAGLKALIRSRAYACASEMKQRLKL